MGLSKFPVISENGNEYKVDVWLDDIVGHFIVEVFRERKGVFGLFKWERLSGGLWDSRYDAEEWEYDLIAMAKHQVQKYENGIENSMLHEKKVEEAYNKFAEWDGKISS